MGKRIVVGIDGSPASLAAVHYLAVIFGKSANIKIDLLHILSGPPPLFLEPGENMAEMVQLQGFAERMEQENRQRADSMMAEAKDILTAAGMKAQNIRSLIKEHGQGAARDILELEDEKTYDAIVLGRHGIGALERFVMGSVTHTVLHHLKGLPLCVVQASSNAGKIKPDRLLVTVDGSPNSKRVLDHAAWFLTETGPTEVTVFHVLPPLIADEMVSAWTGLIEMNSNVEQRVIEEAEDMLSQAKTYLTESGVPAFSITTRLETKATGIARAILKEASEGRYGSVMIGRRGISRVMRFLLGSVSNKVVQEATDMAVWVVC